MTPEEMKQVLDTLEREIRLFSILGLPGEPPPLPRPVDGKAEVEVVAALVGGNVVVGDLLGLHLKHFEHPYHRVIFEIAPSAPVDTDGCLSLEFLENELRNRGFRGPLSDWLLTIRDEIPFRGREACLAAAARLRELWRRRRIIEKLQTLESQLRTDCITADDCVAELRRISAKTSGPAKERSVA